MLAAVATYFLLAGGDASAGPAIRISETELNPSKGPSGKAKPVDRALEQEIDAWLIDQYRGCWHYFGPVSGIAYVPKIRVEIDADGALTSAPVLLNPSENARDKKVADSALAAVRRCHPMVVPDRYKAFASRWSRRTIRFDPLDFK